MESLDLFYGTIPQVMFGAFVFYMFAEIFFIGNAFFFLGGFILLIVVLAYILFLFKKSFSVRLNFIEERRIRKHKESAYRLFITACIIFAMVMTANAIFFLFLSN